MSAEPVAAGSRVPAVAIRGLSRRFGDVAAVAELEFQVEQGELFGLVGADGAGKTTSLRMLAGVLRPSAGDALIFGVSVARQPERVKPDLAYMSQRFGLYADLTVAENLAFYADLYEVPRRERDERLARLFQFSNLAPFRDRLAGKLSGGMKQKLGLSCALIHQPRLLLLDEPTFGVDPISRRDLWRIVHEMVAAGVTAVVSTSYLDEAERFDRVALLDRGRVLEVDSPGNLVASFSGELIEVRAEPLARLHSVAPALPGVRRAAAFGDRLHLTLEPGLTIAQITAGLEREGISGIEARPIVPALEDVVIERLELAGKEPKRQAREAPSRNHR